MIYLFQGSSHSTSKLTTTVKFPLAGFDISEHVAGRTCFGNSAVTDSNKMLAGVWSPWKKPKRVYTYVDQHIYDLYAVCNHHGKDLQGGHYTGKLAVISDL